MLDSHTNNDHRAQPSALGCRRLLCSIVIGVLFAATLLEPNPAASEEDQDAVGAASEQVHGAVEKALDSSRQNVLFTMSGMTFGGHSVLMDHVDAYENATVCRRKYKPWHPEMVFFFEPRSDEIAEVLMGSRWCVRNDSEKPPIEHCKEHITEKFDEFESEGASMHGYAWPFESGDEKDAVELSRRRLETVREWIQDTDLSSIDEEKAQGTALSNTMPNLSPPMLGVYIKLEQHSPIPTLAERRGPPLTDAQQRAVASFVESAVSKVPMSSHGRTIWVEYRPIDRESSEHIDGRETDSLPDEFDRYVSRRHGIKKAAELDDWAQAMFDNGCDVSKVGLPGERDKTK